MNARLNWHDASYTCQTLGAMLAEPRSAMENMILKGMFTSSGESNVWLGAHDMVTEGKWEWASSGDPISGFTDWRQGEPNNLYGNEHCLEFQKPSMQWNDEDCGEVQRFICQYDMASFSTVIGRRQFY